ncbi:MAG: hypothetical protein WCD79_12430 [Chthoniobacteraceae bacterium]
MDLYSLEWRQQQEAVESVRRFNSEVAELRDSPVSEITDNAALWLVTRYIVATKKMEGQDGELSWKLMREFCNDLVALRRGDHSSARLVIDSKRQMAQEHFSRQRWKRSVINGLETFRVYVDGHPKAKAAYDELVK